MKNPKSPFGIFIMQIRNLEAKLRSERKLKMADELKARLDELAALEREKRARTRSRATAPSQKPAQEAPSAKPAQEAPSAAPHVCVREESRPGTSRAPAFKTVISRAGAALNCRDMDFLRQWYEDQCAADWHDAGGNPLHNWGRKLAIDWRYWAKNKAERIPNLAAARRKEEENAIERMRALRQKAIAEACEGLENIDA